MYLKIFYRLITTLQREINQQKEKDSKQGQLLDEEQLENNKLSERLEQSSQKSRAVKAANSGTKSILTASC